VDQVTFTSEAFYNRDDVKAALHAPTNITWHGCRWGEGRRHLSSSPRRLGYMDYDHPIKMENYMSDVLDAGIPLLVYNGDRDMTTNMVGQERVLNSMDWSGKKEWLDAPRGLWMTKDYESGWAKEYDTLTFVVVYNSGHMVPYNQPVPAFDLLQRFLRHESFIDTELPQLRVKKDKKGVAFSMADTIVPISPASSLGTVHHHGMESMVVVALVAFVAGVVVTLLFVRGSRRDYQRMP